ncbi:MAG: hypothetical protein ACYCZV_17780 [Acidimicrobiales bacterium]
MGADRAAAPLRVATRSASWRPFGPTRVVISSSTTWRTASGSAEQQKAMRPSRMAPGNVG